MPFKRDNDIEIEFNKKGNVKSLRGETNRGKKGFLEQMKELNGTKTWLSPRLGACVEVLGPVAWPSCGPRPGPGALARQTVSDSAWQPSLSQVRQCWRSWGWSA